jgi:hypothetical protein
MVIGSLLKLVLVRCRLQDVVGLFELKKGPSRFVAS